MTRRLAAVTGATGFLGRHLVRALTDRGWDVRVLARRDPIHPLWTSFTPEVVVGGLESDAALDRLCAGADLMVHAAGLTKAHTLAQFEAVNVLGTERVAARVEGRMLLVSSLAAREPQLSDYAASKRGGESVAQALLGERVSVVRPPALYGPGDPETLDLFRAAQASPVLPLFDPAARIALMHVQDAARQLAAIAGMVELGGATVALCDANPAGYGWREIFDAAARATGGQPGFFRASDRLITLAAMLARLAPSASAPMLSVGKAREIRHLDWAVHANERVISPDLPNALFDINQGFTDAVNGYRAFGFLR